MPEQLRDLEKIKQALKPQGPNPNQANKGGHPTGPESIRLAVQWFGGFRCCQIARRQHTEFAGSAPWHSARPEGPEWTRGHESSDTARQ